MCKNFYFPCLLIFSLKPAAITYPDINSRFGDSLVTYIHAKWISFLYDIPLLYKPFPYSDQLVMHTTETRYSTAQLKTFQNVITIKRSDHIKFDKNSKILYVIPYFPESAFEYQLYHFNNLLFNVDWNNPVFKQILKSVIAPAQKLPEPNIPTNMPSIAVHVRTKSGADILFRDGLCKKPATSRAYSDINFPLKHITEDYYVVQLKKLHDILGRPHAYVYIFTDDANPPAVKAKIETAVNRSELIFDCRQPGNHHCTGVIEDFFAMTKFQYFIGNDSNFSMISSLISDHLIAIRPIYDWSSQRVLIDQATVTIHPTFLEKIIIKEKSDEDSGKKDHTINIF